MSCDLNHTVILMCTYVTKTRKMQHYCNLWSYRKRSYQGCNGFINAIVYTLSKLLGGFNVCWCKYIPIQSAIDAALCLIRPQSYSCGVCVFAYVLVHRPNKENTGEVSESGASVVKHALNPEKPFMQVHYLKVCLIAQSTDSSGTWSFGLCRVALSLSFSGLLPLEVSGWSGWRREVSALLQSVCGKIPRAAHSVSGECVLHGSCLANV